MRFSPYIRIKPLVRSPQRMRAAAQAVRKDKDEMALFPELVRHEDAHARLDAIEADLAAYWQRLRDLQAATWRRSRQRLRSMQPTLRAQVINMWNAGWLPADATYLADLITQAERGFPLACTT